MNSSYSAESAPWLSATVSVMARAATEREGAASLRVSERRTMERAATVARTAGTADIAAAIVRGR